MNTGGTNFFGESMKCRLLSALVGLALVPMAPAQTATYYVNDGIVNFPPQVDAFNFINNGTFNLSLGGFGTFFVGLNQFGLLSSQPYETANTLTYTNRGLMQNSSGFRFETFSTQTGLRRPASSFVNQATGTLNCGTTSNANNIIFYVNTGSKCIISATNVINRGNINMGGDSLVSIKGDNLDLSRGLVNMQSGFNTFGDVGVRLDGYWGVGTTVMDPARFLTAASTPAHWVTNRHYQTYQTSLFLNSANAYVRDVFSGASNRVVQVAFVQNPNVNMSNQVYFGSGTIQVEWIWAQDNLVTGGTVTNHMFLTDTFGSPVSTNLVVLTNGVAAPNTGFAPAFIPTNYTFFSGLFGGGQAATPGLPSGTFTFGTITNEYAAYQALFSASSTPLGDLAGQTVATLPGRIEINADKYLNLDRARISSLNYLSVNATNHFASSSRAKIISAFASMNLATTNGNLAFTNMIAPVVPRLEGPVNLWSARWTEVDATGVTNRYHVLFVDSQVSTTTSSEFVSLSLRSTNVVFSDVVNVQSNLLIEAESLTLTTNQPGAPTPYGEINLLNGQIFWPTSTPRLRYLTNNGVIQTLNAVFFGGSRSQPFFSSNYNEPYEAFVNTGTINNQGSQIWSKYFENYGSFLAGVGSISLEQCRAAGLLGGTLLALSGDISLTSGSLVMAGVQLHAGRALSLSPTNLLTDAGIPDINSWSVGDGMNLYTRPEAGDLLGTTISNRAPIYAEVFNTWAAEDRGCSSSGFTNNAALGRLLLDGGNDSLFTFIGAGTNNALYVDYLELLNYTTNRDANGDFIGLDVAPNMRIYFAQAVANGASIAEKLDGQNGGRFCWVSSYAGFYSSTNLVYPDGSIYTVNAALVQSCKLDSDGDGIPNCVDPTPITPPLRPEDLALSVGVLNQPAPRALVSWQSRPSAANYVYYQNSFGGTNWLLLTNFVSGATGGRVSVTDAINPAKPRSYRVRVDVVPP